jgi:GT2 family glycosyltransferase
MIDVSVIMVNWNAAPVLVECLRKTLPELGTVSGECIIVDNGSAAEDLELLKREFPKIRVIANPSNVGFARAVNQGITQSRGRYLLLLNPDAFLSEGSLRPLVSYLDAEPGVGIVGPLITNPDGSLQGSARAFPRLITAIFGRSSLLSRLFPRNPFTRRQVLAPAAQRDRPQPVDWVSGACMFVRRRVLEEVGLLDERFFLYWEDADICWRARERGWQIVYHPHVSATHLVGVCSRRAPIRSLAAFHRSAYRFYRTHVTGSAWHPLNAVAFAGLSLRFAAMSGWLLIRRLVRPTSF